jgi:hypothetical protein
MLERVMVALGKKQGLGRVVNGVGGFVDERNVMA